MTEFESKRGGARVSVPPPLVFLAMVGLGLAVHFVVYRFPIAAPLAIRIAVGVALAAAGLVVGGAAIVHFRRTGQDPAPWMPTPSLVLRGPYRFTRNPMYVGMTLLTVAIGVLANGLWIVFLAFVGLAIVHVTAVRPEERYLTHKFGDPYTQYCAKVRRYL